MNGIIHAINLQCFNEFISFDRCNVGVTCEGHDELRSFFLTY
jgi:hypothetical protein